MELTAGAVVIIFLLLLYLETKRRNARHLQLIAEEKSDIAGASRMTATMAVFYPDAQTTVIMGASEEFGAFYYRVLRQTKVINRSKINLSNISRVELLINSQLQEFSCSSEQPTSSLKATEISNKVLSRFSPDTLKSLWRVGLRIIFLSETGSEKTLEITVLRSSDERQRFKRVQLLKSAVWWCEFLNIGSRQARHVRARLEAEAGQ